MPAPVSTFPPTPRQPVLFFGHGSPLNAIEDNSFSRAWRDQGAALPQPTAVLCVSAHWETRGTFVTAMTSPRTIHDFYGFPPQLNAIRYPAPGSPELADLVREITGAKAVTADMGWGLDHGTWSVLVHLYPNADIPIVQLSLDTLKSPSEHYALGQALAPLRRRGVLILGSGNLVHNLRTVCWEDRAFPWARDFDAAVRDLISARDHASLVHYDSLPNTRLAIPTNEHYLPLLYILALREADELPAWFCEQVTMCSISMRGLRFG